MKTSPLVMSFADRAMLAEAVADMTLLRLTKLLAEPGRKRVDIAVTGGTDGNAVLRAMSTNALLDAVDWSRVHVWWGDERFVAAHDADRNALQARADLFNVLIDSGRMNATQLHEMPADTRDADEVDTANAEQTKRVLDEAAHRYAAELHRELGARPTFDIMMFGIGPDAHFASLFPNYPQLAIDDDDTLVAGVMDSPKLPPLRLTLTVPMITRSHAVWLITSGERKAPAVAKILSRHSNPSAPASYAAAEDEFLLLTDTAALSEVE